MFFVGLFDSFALPAYFADIKRSSTNSTICACFQQNLFDKSNPRGWEICMAIENHISMATGLYLCFAHAEV